MSFIKYRVRVMEYFKDGNVLEGRLLKPEEVLVLDEQDFNKVVNSGGVLEIIDHMVPNPLKNIPDPVPSVDPKPVRPEDLPAVVEKAKKVKAPKKAKKNA